MGKKLLISLGISVVYFVISWGYFFGGFYYIDSKSIFKWFEIVLTLPAAIIFGIGFSGGDIYIACLLVLLVIWVMVFIMALIITKLIDHFKRTKS